MPDNISGEKQLKIQTLTQQIEHMDQTLRERYYNVGRVILERVEKENREIEQIVDQMIEMKKELVKMKGEVRCSNCFQYNEPGSCYCSRCGKKLEETR